MKKTAVCCLALGLCLYALGLVPASSILPNFTPHQTQSAPASQNLAILAATPTPTPTGSAPLNPAAPGHPAVDDSATDNIPEVVVFFPTPEGASPPAMAPVPLPTVTPTAQPVALAAQSKSPVVADVAAAAANTVADAAPAPEVAANPSPGGCSVTNPPIALGLDPFYTKYCSALGIPIVASTAVPDRALQQAWNIVTQMLSTAPRAEEIRNAIIATSTRIGVIGAGQATTDMPEHRSLYTLFPGVDWDTRARGVGATTEIPLLSIGEENLLCYANDRWTGQNVLVHEFAHTIKNMGLDRIDPTFHAEVQRIYQQALDAGLWTATYVISDVEEYWAEGVRLYFQREAAGVPAGQSYPANSRAELQRYDPQLYRIVESIFGPTDGIASCPGQ